MMAIHWVHKIDPRHVEPLCTRAIGFVMVVHVNNAIEWFVAARDALPLQFNTGKLSTQRAIVYCRTLRAAKVRRTTALLLRSWIERITTTGSENRSADGGKNKDKMACLIKVVIHIMIRPNR